MQSLWKVTGTPMPKKSFTPSDKIEAMEEAIDKLHKKGIKSRHHKYRKANSQLRKKNSTLPSNYKFDIDLNNAISWLRSNGACDNYEQKN